MSNLPPILRPQQFMEFKRFPDGKPVFVDPSMVAEIEPHPEDDKTTSIRLYALGGTVSVKGEPENVAAAIQRVRNAMAEVTIFALVDILREEVERTRDTIGNDLN